MGRALKKLAIGLWVGASLNILGAVPSVAAQVEPTYTLDLRIGRVDGNGPDVFGRIESIEVDARGRIYALDEMNHRVVVLDPTGKPIRTFGREGGGPGEFEEPVALSWYRSDQLLVVDRSSYVIFDTAGVYVTEFRRPSTTQSYWAGDAQNGVICDYTSGGFIRVDETQKVTNTLPMPRPEVPRTQNRAQIPFAPYNDSQYQADCRAGGVWNVDPAAAAIHLISFSGDTLRRLPHGLERQQIPADARRAGIEFAATRLVPGDRPGVRSRVSADEIERATPTTYPYFSSSFVTDAGEVWLSLPRTPSSRTAYIQYAVISPDGAKRTEVLAGGHTVRPIVAGQYLYTVIAGELGVNYILRYRRKTGEASAGR